jgi:two-component system response regulator AtoC
MDEEFGIVGEPTELKRPAGGVLRAPVVAVADDDLAFANYLKAFLDEREYQARVYGRGEDLVAAIRRGEIPDVALLDVVMPGMDGLETLRRIKAACPDLQVIMLSGRENAATIVEALGLGAVNYVVKPDDPEGLGEIALHAAVKQVLEKNRLVSEVTELRRQVDDDQAQVFLFWEQSQTMRLVATMIDRVADNDVTVLIRGESGVGKELVARAIHDRSQRRARPFVKVNCAALPDELLESELFGHEKGAFTGAATLRIGKFEHADRGTLMLDEIGEMKPALQGKLLHVLQDGEFSRLGSNKRVTSDVRIIAATNRDLEAMLERGDFREDLYYRLRVIEIVVPPLRERSDEIPQLFAYFVDKYSKRYNRPAPLLTDELRGALCEHSWPGNIRELENVVKRFVILKDDGAVLQDLRTADRGRARQSINRAGVTVAMEAPDGHETPAPVTPVNGSKTAADSNGQPLSLADAARAAILQAERDLIVPTLRRVHWNRRKAAPLLGISYKTLLNKIKEYGIVPD